MRGERYRSIWLPRPLPDNAGANQTHADLTTPLYCHEHTERRVEDLNAGRPTIGMPLLDCPRRILNDPGFGNACPLETGTSGHRDVYVVVTFRQVQANSPPPNTPVLCEYSRQT